MESGVVEVVVEIPKGSRNKYEYDHERNFIRLDRRLLSATTTYPADYGFIPDARTVMLAAQASSSGPSIAQNRPVPGRRLSNPASWPFEQRSNDADRL